MKKIIAILLVSAILVTLLCSCGSREKFINKDLDQNEKVTLKICGPWADSKAIETVSEGFCEKYPNCDIEYEYVQNYVESLKKRLTNDPFSVDLFLTENIQKSSPIYPYAEELFSHSELNFSDTNEALINNFTLIGTAKDNEKKIYSIPLGGELRGLYVNKTLLKSLGLDVPKNADELLSACNTLKNAGYVPMNGNPGMFGQRLLYPYVCNLIVNSPNYQKTYNRVNSCEKGVSELFRKPMEFMYVLTENYYYNYKYVENELGMFTDNSDEGCARYFFDIREKDDEFKKENDLGTVAFMAGTLTQKSTMEKIKNDYHSKIDYEFILAPVSDDGGFAYISPFKGIAINKNTTNMDWSIEFMNYLFCKDINEEFAKNCNVIPNTNNSFSVIKKQFNIPLNRISDLGKATFDYEFYSIINDSLVDIAKGNNPKYMNTDKNGNPSMYSFEYYMENLENEFQKARENGAKND